MPLWHFGWLECIFLVKIFLYPRYPVVSTKAVARSVVFTTVFLSFFMGPQKFVDEWIKLWSEKLNWLLSYFCMFLVRMVASVSQLNSLWDSFHRRTVFRLLLTAPRRAEQGRPRSTPARVRFHYHRLLRELWRSGGRIFITSPGGDNKGARDICAWFSPPLAFRCKLLGNSRAREKEDLLEKGTL